MDYEKKYEDAVKKLEKFFTNDNDRILYKHDIENVFPELKKSEDVRIRNEIIQSIQDNMVVIHKDKCIAWLEKQGEQKPTDKVEPKFKVGDWIYHEISSNTFRINKIENGLYVSDEGATISLGRQNDWRLWTIQDAKEGDVLAVNDDTIIIFKNLYDGSTFHSSCYIENDIFRISKDDMPDWWSCKGFYPAIKEQRDFLFQKMKEAGYEWDDEKKELKKIEQKPAWSEEDERYYDSALWHIKNSSGIEGNIYNWLKSLRERMKGE